MNVVDQDMEKNQKKKKNLAVQQEANTEPEDMELTLAAKPAPFLNIGKGLFDETAQKTWSGLNTAPSVFSSQAIFHTENNE